GVCVVRGCVFVFQAEDGIRYRNVTGVQTCALPIFSDSTPPRDSARVISFVFATSASALASVSVRRETTPPKPLICRFATSCPGRSEERRVGKESGDVRRRDGHEDKRVQSHGVHPNR